MKITATNKATGEVIDLPADTPQQIVEAWRVAQEYVKAADTLKAQLKKLVPNMVDSRGVSEPVGNYMFRVSNIQRMTYSIGAMREYLDSDIVEALLKPNKVAVDTYLKENLKSLGERSTLLRKSMIPDGPAYEVIKLEKISEDA